MGALSGARLTRGAAWFAAGAVAAGSIVWYARPQLALPLVPSPASHRQQAVTAAPPEFVPGAVIVRFCDGGMDASRVSADLGSGSSLQLQETINSDTHDVTLHFNPRIPVSQVVDALHHDSEVVFAEPDGVYQAFYTPNDPYYDESYDSSGGPLDQWYLRKIAAPEAWETLRKVRSQLRLAIIDTGIDYTHPDLKEIMARDSKGEPVGKNFIDGGDSRDDHGHGTHCAGIAAADTDNKVGVAGVGFHSFQLVSAKVLSEQGYGQWDWIANAITWCADNGCRVESMSLGGAGYSQGIQDAINYAWKKGVIVVAAAGNSASSSPSYPAGNNHVVAVSATDPNDRLCSFSNYGTPISIGAPGIKILATIPIYPCTMTKSGRIKNNYDGLAGTSMACPVVAGTLAALLAYQPTLTPTEAIQRLEQTADNTANARNGGWEAQFGHGRVNLANAILNKPRSSTVGSFYGQVTNGAGAPVPGSTVRCGQVSVITRVDGMFRLPNLKAGSYTITASGDGQTGQVVGKIVLGADSNVGIVVKGG